MKGEILERLHRIHGPAATAAPTLARAEAPDIAVVGVSGRFGEAASIEAFWEALRDGHSLIREVPAERSRLSPAFHPDRFFAAGDGAERAYSKWGSFLSDIDRFDALFFGISGAEAENMDPQQRIFLEECWRALEDAGHAPRSLAGARAGVYVGVGVSDYPEILGERAERAAFWGNSTSVLPARISYLLDLKGPAIAVDTACSSSLVAMHLACQGLWQRETDLALAGGAFIQSTPRFFQAASRAQMLSPDGVCYAFDDRANGFVPGEAVAVVVMKRLEDALADGDHVYALIRGSALNQDGATNGITAPSGLSQTQLLREVYERSGIDPSDISYVEAHGTGTRLGDPIEFDALRAAFRAFTQDRGFCALGSVKTNIGHTITAAGISGVVKILLSMKHGLIPPSLNFGARNRRIELDESPFFVNTARRPWPRQRDRARLAAISSFGFSGTNAHMVLEAFDRPRPLAPASEGPFAFLLSARRPEALRAYAKALHTSLTRANGAEGEEAQALADIAYTLQVGRDPMEHRLAIVAASRPALLEALTQHLEGAPPRPGVYVGHAARGANEAAGEGAIERWIAARDVEALARAWAQGSPVPWERLYGAARPRRTSLPTYPFQGKRHWLSREASAAAHAETPPPPAPPPFAAPPEARERAHEAPKATPRDTAWTRIRLTWPEPGVALIQLDDAASRNMISRALLAELEACFGSLHDRPDLKCVVLTGTDRVFCMGGDDRTLLDIAAGRAEYTDAPFAYRGLLDFDVPVITAMQGHAYGAGLVFGLYGDLIIAAEEGVYAANFMRYGFTPGLGATYVLERTLGRPLAAEMMYTGRSFRGDELRARGAGIRVAPAAEVLDQALQLARSLAEKPRRALGLLKRELADRWLSELPAHIGREVAMQRQTFADGEVAARIERHFARSAPNRAAKEANPPAPERPERPERPRAPLPAPSAPLPARGEGAVKRTVRLRDLHASTEPSHPRSRDEQPLPEQASPEPAAPARPASAMVIFDAVCELAERILRVDRAELGPDITFQELGMDSIAAVELIRDVNRRFGTDLEAVVLYDHPTLGRLSRLVEGALGARGTAKDTASHSSGDELDTLLARLERGEIDAAEAERLLG